MQRHINKGKKRHPSYSMAECDNERNHNNEIMAVVEMDLERGLLRNVNKLDLLGDFRQSNSTMPGAFHCCCLVARKCKDHEPHGIIGYEATF